MSLSCDDEETPVTIFKRLIGKDEQTEPESRYTQIKSKPTTDAADSSKSEQSSNLSSFLILGLVFLTCLIAMITVYLNFPEIHEDERQYLKLPRNMDDAKNLGGILSRYKDVNYLPVLGAFFFTYIFLQSFAIPGSIFLSVLSGFLFPFPLALFLVCLCACIGASFCYMLSYMFGRHIVQRYLPDRIKEWQTHVNHHRDHLLNYIIFLRITPFLPNWFINITSPLINVPLSLFSIGTFIGVAPPSFVAVHAGTTLHQLTSSSDVLSWTSVMILAAFAVISLLPVIFKKKLQEKFD